MIPNNVVVIWVPRPTLPVDRRVYSEKVPLEIFLAKFVDHGNHSTLITSAGTAAVNSLTRVDLAIHVIIISRPSCDHSVGTVQ